MTYSLLICPCSSGPGLFHCRSSVAQHPLSYKQVGASTRLRRLGSPTLFELTKSCHFERSNSSAKVLIAIIKNDLCHHLLCCLVTEEITSTMSSLRPAKRTPDDAGLAEAQSRPFKRNFTFPITNSYAGDHDRRKSEGTLLQSSVTFAFTPCPSKPCRKSSSSRCLANWLIRPCSLRDS